MRICTGRGDSGDHCCYIAGEVCQFLFTDRGGTPRCGIWGEWETRQWRESPVGQWMAQRYPGYNCSGWPQNIPEAMAKGRGLCCWQEE